MEAIILHQGQKQIVEDTHRFRVVNCGRRWGKTTLAVEEIKARGWFIGGNIVYIAPTYQQARDIAWKSLKGSLNSVAKSINESRLEINIQSSDNAIKDEANILLRGWESIETLRGQSFDFIVIDEIAMMRNFWEHWQEVVRPTLTDTKGDVLFISTPKGFNHFYDLYQLETDDIDFKSFHFTSYDNPFLDKEEIDSAQKQMTPDRFSQEYMADFRKAEGLVYKEFSRGLHVFDELPDTRYYPQTVLGIDFGFTNPTAILQIKVDKDNNFWVTGEWYKSGKTNSQIIEAAQSFEPNLIYPDPEAPEKILEMRNAGLYVRDVKKGKDSVVTGIDKVRELFKQNKIKIHKGCVNLIYELETYHYPDKKPDKNEYELPVAENDHALDALRYVIMTHVGQIDNRPKTVIPNFTYNRV